MNSKLKQEYIDHYLKTGRMAYSFYNLSPKDKLELLDAAEIKLKQQKKDIQLTIDNMSWIEHNGWWIVTILLTLITFLIYKYK